MTKSTRAGSCVFFMALAIGALGIPADVAAQGSTPVLTEQPPGNGTPISRTPDGRADLSGFWNKGTHPQHVRSDRTAAVHRGGFEGVQ